MVSGTGAGSMVCQVMSWRQASRSTHPPMGTIRPVSSAVGMKSTGDTIPRSTCGQRISASKPMMSPVASSTIGW